MEDVTIKNNMFTEKVYNIFESGKVWLNLKHPQFAKYGSAFFGEIAQDLRSNFYELKSLSGAAFDGLKQELQYRIGEENKYLTYKSFHKNHALLYSVGVVFVSTGVFGTLGVFAWLNKHWPVLLAEACLGATAIVCYTKKAIDSVKDNERLINQINLIMNQRSEKED